MKFAYELVLILLGAIVGLFGASGYHIAHHPATEIETDSNYTIGGKIFYLLNTGARARIIPDKETLEHLKYDVHLQRDHVVNETRRADILAIYTLDPPVKSLKGMEGSSSPDAYIEFWVREIRY